jgi:TfoX/Sxy family transcriptional regulator of competence genes
MAYDESLAEKVADYLESQPDVTERKMFGGIGFMIQGNMAVGVSKDSLMVRVGAEGYEQALAQPHVKKVDMSGREMSGWVLVEPPALADEVGLSLWIDRGRAMALTFPPK